MSDEVHAPCPVCDGPVLRRKGEPLFKWRRRLGCCAPRAKKPTIYQSRILAMSGRSSLMKTYTSDRKVVWGLANGREVSDKCAEALIRNGWVRPQRDGLGLFEESQTYVSLTP